MKKIYIKPDIIIEHIEGVDILVSSRPIWCDKHNRYEHSSSNHKPYVSTHDINDTEDIEIEIDTDNIII